MTYRRAGHRGFSLIEILITLVVLSFVMAAAGTLFNNLLGDFRQQSKITETGIDTNIGLQLIKKDVENAGYGLPWNLGGLGYSEPADPFTSTLTATSNPPPSFSFGTGGLGGADYLTVRSMPVAGTDPSRKWTLLAAGGNARRWGDPREDLDDTDYVAVIRPGPAGGDQRTLGGTTTFQLAKINLCPPTTARTFMVYGLGTANTTRPFNRADYFISTDNVAGPPICAAGTGTLVKSVVNPDGTHTVLPLLDCVRDMQITFQFSDNTGLANGLAGHDGNAQGIRDNLRTVQIFILAHEGRRDERYRHDTASIDVGAPVGLTRNATLSTDDLHYRWRVYSVVVRPTTLR